jgi:hypothetical protein
VIVPSRHPANDQTPGATQVAEANGGTPIPSGPTAADIAANLRELLNNIRTDSSRLQQQFINVQSGKSLDCKTEFTNPQPYNVPPGVAANLPALNDIAAQLNTAASTLATAKGLFDEGCQNGAAPLTNAEVSPQMEAVINLLKTTLPAADSALTSAQATAQALPSPTPIPAGVTQAPTETLAPSLTPTEKPTVVPTATIAPNTIKKHLTSLDYIVEEVTGLRGSNTLLDQYWHDAQEAGKTDGCRPPYPIIPDDYPPLDGPVKAAYPDLDQAISLVNLGLAQTRQSWTIFQNACTTGNLQTQANTGIQFTQNAAGAFASARDLLDTVRKQVR